jgi:hypothetical protein
MPEIAKVAKSLRNKAAMEYEYQMNGIGIRRRYRSGVYLFEAAL